MHVPPKCDKYAVDLGHNPDSHPLAYLTLPVLQPEEILPPFPSTVLAVAPLRLILAPKRQECIPLPFIVCILGLSIDSRRDCATKWLGKIFSLSGKFEILLCNER